jgi:hypothetical protein
MDIVTDADLYYHVVGRTGTTRYFTLAAVCALTWDWGESGKRIACPSLTSSSGSFSVLMLPEEVDLVWKRDWKMAGKPLYLLVRYGGIAFQMYDLTNMMGTWSKNVRDL